MTTQTNGPLRDTAPPEIFRVIEAFDEIVRPEGGSVSFVAVEGGKLRVAYAAGVNEGCPTCVMSRMRSGSCCTTCCASRRPRSRRS